MTNWENYTKKIIALNKEGLSSKEISILLSKTDDDITEHSDRSIRRILQKHREENNIVPKSEPAKILVFDIETAPIIAYTWSRFPKMIGDQMIKQDSYVINWAAKWLFNDNILSDVVTPQESLKQDDSRIIKSMWKLLDEAEIVITHNGDKFDIKRLNGRFIKYGLNLPSPYQSIDTYKSARRKLNLTSLKLNFIAEYLGIASKLNTSFDLWVGCMNGDEKSLEYMDKYCKQDVLVLEEVYLHLRPFIQPHPPISFNIGSDISTCPTCASDNLKKEGTYNTTVNQYDSYRCNDCGSLSRSRQSSLKTSDRKSVLSSIPR